jgi:hypothetical protein
MGGELMDKCQRFFDLYVDADFVAWQKACMKYKKALNRFNIADYTSYNSFKDWSDDLSELVNEIIRARKLYKRYLGKIVYGKNLNEITTCYIIVGMNSVGNFVLSEINRPHIVKCADYLLAYYEFFDAAGYLAEWRKTSLEECKQSIAYFKDADEKFEVELD